LNILFGDAGNRPPQKFQNDAITEFIHRNVPRRRQYHRLQMQAFDEGTDAIIE
jgi:hypothetical protein